MKVLDRLEIPPEMEQDRSVRYIRGDLRDSAVVHEAVRETDVIIHLAWSFADDPKTVFADDIQGHNIQGHIHLLDAASSSGVKN